MYPMLLQIHTTFGTQHMEFFLARNLAGSVHVHVQFSIIVFFPSCSTFASTNISTSPVNSSLTLW